MKAIPTEYGGVQFRSRLEARWAAFFDLLKWKWDYEPIDLDGWIPDFVLHGRETAKLFVEVKPIFERDPKVCAKMINASGDGNRLLLLVGAGLPDSRTIGWLGNDQTFPELSTTWRPMHFVDLPQTPHIGLIDSAFVPVEFFTGAVLMRGDQRLSESSSADIQLKWAQAGNAVQWKRPR